MYWIRGLVPDGASKVKIMLQDGSAKTVSVVSNTFAVTVSQPVRSKTVLDSNGQTISTRTFRGPNTELGPPVVTSR
ncbi:MAG: hypothetical protein M3Y17_00905 [Actinomycetota bacterium]|nr:hypothetical protein [Actinomycetota bacterium]